MIDSLSAIDVPTLLIAGAQDVVDGYDYVAPTRYMAGKIQTRSTSASNILPTRQG